MKIHYRIKLKAHNNRYMIGKIGVGIRDHFSFFFLSFWIVRANVYDCSGQHRQIPDSILEPNHWFLPWFCCSPTKNSSISKAAIFASYNVCNDDRRARVQRLLYRR